MRNALLCVVAAGLTAAVGAPVHAEASRAWIDARRQLSGCLSGPELGRGACLERAARALDAAEARGEGPIPNAEQAQAARRRDYGMRVQPTAPVAPRTPERERSDRLVTTLVSVRQDGEGDWVMRTAEGAVWVQTDHALLTPAPRAGSSFFVRPGALGSFFCLIDNRREVRCKRRG